jgi:hypothetical protein
MAARINSSTETGFCDNLFSPLPTALSNGFFPVLDLNFGMYSIKKMAAKEANTNTTRLFFIEPRKGTSAEVKD